MGTLECHNGTPQWQEVFELYVFIHLGLTWIDIGALRSMFLMQDWTLTRLIATTVYNLRSRNPHCEFECTSTSKYRHNCEIAFYALTDLFAEVESDAVPILIHASTLLILSLIESIKDSRSFICWHSNSIIFDCNLKHVIFRVTILASNLSFDLNDAESRELDCVCQQVVQHLLDTSFIEE